MYHFVEPRSVAVIGASTVLQKAGGRRWKSLVTGGFAGGLYPINPSAPEVMGRQAFKSIREIPSAIDLAVIIVRPNALPEIIDDCVQLRIPAVMVISGGFGEAGKAGRAAEQALCENVRSAGGRVLGPNCAGIFNAKSHLNLLGWTPPSGSVGCISQSGGMALMFARFARQRGLGFSSLITIGNAADLKPSDCIAHLLNDPDTKAIMMYLEGFGEGEGERFCRVVKSHCHRKPIVISMPGRTEAGQRAVLSHTGTLAGKQRVADAALAESGVLRIDDTEEAWDALKALVNLPLAAGKAMAVIADGGGAAAVVSDAAVRLGMLIPTLNEDARDSLRSFLVEQSSVGNPVDLAIAEESPRTIPQSLDVCLGQAEVSGALLAGHFGGYFKMSTDEIATAEIESALAIAEVVRRHAKPVIVQTIYADDDLLALTILKEAGIPIFLTMEASAKAMSALVKYSAISRASWETATQTRRSRPNAAQVQEILRTGGSDQLLLEPEARELLQQYGIIVPPFEVVQSSAGALRAATTFQCSVAMKLISRFIVHKSDAGGVLLNLGNLDAIATAFASLTMLATTLGERKPRILVTPMIDRGVEVTVGAVNDPQFGPVVMFGLGGIHVEALDDVAFAPAPLTEAGAHQLIACTRAGRLLQSRRKSVFNLGELVDTLIRVAELISELRVISALDINPVIASDHGIALADARVILQK